MRMTVAAPEPDDRAAIDGGFTLVELLVAIAIFAMLTGVISTAVVNGYRTIRDVGELSDVQVQQQNALLWITRLLRYADNPLEGYAPTTWVPLGSASTDAGGNSQIVFYTYSATGPVEGVPYKADLRITPDGDLISTVSTPTLVGDEYCWLRTDRAACSGITEDVATRVLVRATTTHAPSFTLTYLDGSGTIVVPPVAADQASWDDWATAVDQVRMSISDDGFAQNVEQTVRLVNPR